MDWVPGIRYSEVLLNVAEAEAGAQTRALAILSAVRNRADASYVFSPFASRQDLVNAILTERRIGLLGEGFRAGDAQRRLLRLAAVDVGIPVSVPDNRCTFSIPTNEKRTNNSTN